MKVLTLTQPWATLVAIGAKRIETRSFPTNHRGPLAIHASKDFPRWAKDLCKTEPFFSVLAESFVPGWYNQLPLGKIIAVVDVVDGLRTSGSLRDGGHGSKYADWVHELAPAGSPERAFGDFTPGRYGWLLENVRQLPEPIPAKGMLGLWNYKSAELDRYAEQGVLL